MLNKTRLETQSLWEEVARYNENHTPSEDKAVKVSFYVGQTIEAVGEEDEIC